MRKEEIQYITKACTAIFRFILKLSRSQRKSVLEYASDLRTFQIHSQIKSLYSFDTEDEKIDLSPIDLNFIQSVKLEDAYQFMIYCKNVRQNNETTRARRVICIRRFYAYLTDNLGIA